MKKLKILQFSLILIVVFFVVFLVMPKGYTKKYTINDVWVEESYNKEDKYYYFTFTYKDIVLDYLIEDKYQEHRSLIKIIDVIKDDNNDNNFCLIPSSKLDIIPLCYQNEEIVYFKEVNSSLKSKLDDNYFKKGELISTYNDINIYNNDYTYLLWNYNGFYYLDSKENKKINILDRELYTISLVGYTNNYLVIPDYDANYTFERIYTIDFKNGNLKNYDIDNDVYFDSYFIGYLKNNLYIVDKKENKMYEFNAKNGKIEKIKSKIYKNGNWENVSIKSLINKKQEFTYKSNYDYMIEDGTLYLTYRGKKVKTKITKDITSVVRIKDNDIFYLKKDSLYHFNSLTGEELLLNYFEWNFNYENMIYIN